VKLKTAERVRSTTLRADRKRPALPLPTRVLLVGAVALLAVAVFATATGGIGTLGKALGASFSDFFANITATPAPSATPIVVADAPVIVSPAEPYTNQTTVDLQLSIPPDSVGDTRARVRIYASAEGGAPAQVAEAPVGETTRLVVPTELSPGRNDFTATLVSGGVESESSPVVTYILDTEPPTITLSDPKDGATVNGETVTLTGKTQGRSTLIARNEANGTSTSGTADSDGSFALTLALDPGPNGIQVQATDPAGNQGQLIIKLVRGSGKLTASLTASAYRIAVSRLPTTIQLTVTVTDPDGKPVEGATVTFTLTAPGIPPLALDTTTGGDGRAVFSTGLPKDVTAGSGMATVLVNTTSFGSVTDRKTLTFVK
jgi:uncharacterized protein YfaP (DUF2135 family)